MCSVALAPLAHESDYIRLIPKKWSSSYKDFGANAFSINDSVNMFISLGDSAEIDILDWDIMYFNPKNSMDHNARKNISDLASNNIFNSSLSVSLFNGMTPYVMLSVRFRREGNFYLMNFVYPMLIMWLIAYITFFLPFEE